MINDREYNDELVLIKVGDTINDGLSSISRLGKSDTPELVEIVMFVMEYCAMGYKVVSDDGVKQDIIDRSIYLIIFATLCGCDEVVLADAFTDIDPSSKFVESDFERDLYRELGTNGFRY